MRTHFQSEQRTLGGRGKMPLAPRPRHTRTGPRARTHWLPQPACPHPSAPSHLLFAGGAPYRCAGGLGDGEGGAGGWGARGGRESLKRVKTLPCRAVNSPQLSPTPLNPAKQQLDIFHPSRERQRREDIPMIPFCMPNRELRCRSVCPVPAPST